MRWGGSPAKPIKQFFRELFEVAAAGREGSAKSKSEPTGNGRRGDKNNGRAGASYHETVDINGILNDAAASVPMLADRSGRRHSQRLQRHRHQERVVNEPAVPGHFPAGPVFPGVLMIEGMAQTAGVIGMLSVSDTDRPTAVYFLTIDKCKFRKPMRPGDIIDYHMRLRDPAAGRCGGFTATPRSTACVAAEADVGAMLAD